jgi:hypothetical protein
MAARGSFFIIATTTAEGALIYDRLEQAVDGHAYRVRHERGARLSCITHPIPQAQHQRRDNRPSHRGDSV